MVELKVWKYLLKTWTYESIFFVIIKKFCEKNSY